MERTLQTKTLIIHFTMMVSRVGFSSLGQSYWQKGYEDREFNEIRKYDVIDALEPTIRFLIVA